MMKNRNNFFITSLLCLFICNSCKPNYKKIDISECQVYEDKDRNQDCTCSHTENGYKVIDNLEGIDEYSKGYVEYNYPIEGLNTISYNVGYYSKSEESTDEINLLVIKLIKFVFNSERYSFYFESVDGGRPYPYYFYIYYNNKKGEEESIGLSVSPKGKTLAIGNWSICIKNPNDNHLYIEPGLRYWALTTEIKKDIDTLAEITNRYLEDKPAELIKF